MKPKPGFQAPPCFFSMPPRAPLILVIVIILMGLFSFVASHAQSGLSVGDKVPDVTIRNVLNHSSSGISLSGYQGRLVIIDFWATWCSPCIAMFPKTDSLQKVFNGKVQFLPVTYQSEKDVRRLLSKIPRLKNLALPMVTGDTTLNKLFPHRELPHYVWIGQDGTIKAITGWQEVTADKISSMLSGSLVSLEEKHDVSLPYDRELPLMLNSLDITAEDMLSGTLLTGYKEGLSMRSDILRYPDGAFRRITCTNSSLKKLFALANSSPAQYYNYNRILVEVKDPSKITMPDPDNASRQAVHDWVRGNTYCYEIKVPHHLSSDIFSIMRQDLERLFPEYQATVEKRNVKCLVLVRTSAVDKIGTSGDPVRFSFDFMEASMTNCSIALLLGNLNGTRLQHLNTPVVDGTGYTGKIDIRLECNLSDVESLRKALHAYDLDLVTKSMDIDMLVIRDAE